MRQTIVVTGSQGKIGRSLVAFLQGHPEFDVRPIDKSLSSAGEGQDLGAYDSGWRNAFAGVDAVIHLAAESCSGAAWSEVLGPNVDATLNVYLAAAEHNVKKIILASSIWVLSGHRFSSGPLNTDTPPDPGVSAYAATKLFAERTAKAFQASHGISTFVFRIGAYAPNMTKGTSEWIQSAWLGDDDMRGAMQAALECREEGVFVLNLVSDVTPGRWDTQPLNTVLKYAPRQKHRMELSAGARVRAFLFYLARFVVPKIGNRTPWYW